MRNRSKKNLPLMQRISKFRETKVPTHSRAKKAHSDLDALFRTAMGNGTGRGGISWAAERLGVARKSVQRWVAGETTPTNAQLLRLQVASDVEARARRIRADRMADRGYWRQVSAWLGGGIFEDVDQALEAHAAEQTRANRPFQSPPVRSWIRSRLTDTAENLDSCVKKP